MKGDDDLEGDDEGERRGELSSERDLRRNLNGSEAIVDELNEDEGVEPGVDRES